MLDLEHYLHLLALSLSTFPDMIFSVTAAGI